LARNELIYPTASSYMEGTGDSTSRTEAPSTADRSSTTGRAPRPVVSLPCFLLLRLRLPLPEILVVTVATESGRSGWGEGEGERYALWLLGGFRVRGPGTGRLSAFSAFNGPPESESWPRLGRTSALRGVSLLGIGTSLCQGLLRTTKSSSPSESEVAVVLVGLRLLSEDPSDNEKLSETEETLHTISSSSSSEVTVEEKVEERDLGETMSKDEVAEKVGEETMVEAGVVSARDMFN
jgi:hypothetical protein